jgi:hypothetical protein
MNKKLITALLSLTLILPLSSTVSQAAPAPTIAILDTALDSTLPIFKDKIAAEVCIMDWASCPNGKTFMEGPGAATLQMPYVSQNGFDHGTQMASVFIANNPNAKIVFVRIIGNTSKGSRQTAGESTVFNALNWVNANKEKYNIQAVTMSQGHHMLGAVGTNYCPATPTTRSSINALVSSGIPVFFPSGNGRDYQRIDWPACIDQSISVGYTDQQGEIAANSNNDNALLDIFALGYHAAWSPGNIQKYIAGSSASVQVAAASWMLIKEKNPSWTYSQVLSAMTSTASSTTGRQGTFNKLINLQAAISYGAQPTPKPTATAVPTVTAEQLAAQQKALLVAESLKAIALAETQYQAEVKAAADKLAAIKAAWAAKING